MTSLAGSLAFALEGRFKLWIGHENRFSLCVLAHDAGIEPEDLTGLVGRQIRVDGEEEPGANCFIVHAVHVADRPAETGT
jgi:hypothetical protein